jgi:Ni/Co efflux regulator RcnB
MKKIILLAVAVAGVFTLVASAQASDAFMSSRAQEQADSLKKVSGMTPDMIDRSVQLGSPKSIALAQSLRKVAGTNNDLDLVHGLRPTMSPKNPGYEAALRENAITGSSR